MSYWIDFGTAKELWIIPIHEIASGEEKSKDRAFRLFHAVFDIVVLLLLLLLLSSGFMFLIGSGHTGF